MRGKCRYNLSLVFVDFKNWSYITFRLCVDRSRIFQISMGVYFSHPELSVLTCFQYFFIICILLMFELWCTSVNPQNKCFTPLLYFIYFLSSMPNFIMIKATDFCKAFTIPNIFTRVIFSTNSYMMKKTVELCRSFINLNSLTLFLN